MSRTNFIWMLFAISGVIFLIGGIRNGDLFSIVASVPWLAGCIMAMLGGDDS